MAILPTRVVTDSSSGCEPLGGLHVFAFYQTAGFSPEERAEL